MVKLLRKIFLFGMIVLACMFFLELALMDIPNEYSLKRDKLENHGSEIKTLILGHSQAFHGLNPDYMEDSTFNCATPLQAPYYDYEILSRYLDSMPNIQTVIWPIMDCFYDFSGNISGYFTIDYNNYVKCMADKYLGIPPLSGNKYIFKSELIWSNWKGADIPRIILNRGKGEAGLHCNGYYAQYGKSPSGRNNANNIEEPEKISDDIKAGALEVIDFGKKISKLCCDNDIRFIILTFPNLNYHDEDLSNNRTSYMYRAVEEILSVNSRGEYYDYSRDNRFIEDDFFDAGHLNDSGATKFSRIIEEEVLRKTMGN